MPRLVTLTTDFGTKDAYVAAMKGVILSMDPTITIVDISHDIAPQDIMEAAFVLRDAAPFFPAGTVHLAVVDPGVGSARRPIALAHRGQFLIGPDNGLFTLLSGGREADEMVVLDQPGVWRTAAVSDTFHGRDIFAPAAARLALGRPLRDLGTPAERMEPLYWALPLSDDQGVQGWIVHIDRFGNGITNITRDHLEAHAAGRNVKGYVGTAIVKGLQRTYSDVGTGEPLMLYGSNGHLEIAVNGGNAAQLFSIRKGASVNVVFSERPT